MTQLFAQPYDISATGFFFETAEEYSEKAASLRNSSGWPVEEFEIQFIDGEIIDAKLFTALGVHQGNFGAFLEAAESWSRDEKIKVIIAVGETGYKFTLGTESPDQFDVDLYEMDTPAGDSNVLHNVSATELKAEEMIKLPIRLSEHKSWEEAVRDSILTRQRLHDIAARDSDYIRPIILFQAEEKGKEVTKEILLAYLVEQEKIPREKIAVVTGDQKELDGINLFSPDCKIDFVITVEALKEGWDCSFAYVFCSVASVYSKKDVEQILGRVLRMPYAKRRKEADLNRAYAHVSRASWPNAVKQLHDRLVDMGFEDNEADSFIEKVPELGLTGGAGGVLFRETPPPTVFELAEDIA